MDARWRSNPNRDGTRGGRFETSSLEVSRLEKRGRRCRAVWAATPRSSCKDSSSCEDLNESERSDVPRDFGFRLPANSHCTQPYRTQPSQARIVLRWSVVACLWVLPLTSVFTLPSSANADERRLSGSADPTRSSSVPPSGTAKGPGPTLGDHFQEESRGDVSASLSETAPSTGATSRTIGLGLTVVLLIVLGILLIRSARKTPRDRAGNRVLQVLARVAVGPKQQVSLTRVGNRVLVLGVTADRITLLDRVDDPAEVGRLLPLSGFDRQLQAEAVEEAGLQGIVESASANGAESDPVQPLNEEVRRIRGVLSEMSPTQDPERLSSRFEARRVSRSESEARK